MSVQSTNKKAKLSRKELALQRREHLIDTALKLFSENGFSDTSIKQIATEASVAAGLLYHYFPDKGELMSAVFERHGFLPELKSILSVESDKSAEQVLVHIAERASALFERKDALFRLIVRESQTNEDIALRLRSVAETGVRAIANYLETRIHIGELKPHDTSLTARILMSTVLTTHLVKLPKPSWREFVSILLSGIVFDSPRRRSKKVEKH